jgi:uncharacterized protein YkwD
MGWWTDFLDLFRRKPPPPPPPTPTGLVADLLIAHNTERSKDHKQTLVLNVLLGVVAQKQADRMNAIKQTTHTGEGGSQPLQRMQDIGYYPLAAGENVAGGYKTVQQVMQGWMNSRQGHKENILSAAYKDVGFGVSGDYWCVVFGTRAVQAATMFMPALSFPEPLNRGVDDESV